MSSTRKKVWRTESNRLRPLESTPGITIPIMTAITSCIVFTTVFASCSLAAAADIAAGKPQIQGGNLRVEFDNRLRSRVVARFDTKETVLGPFTASETLTTAGKVWTEFPLTSQKQERVKDAFGQGTRLTVEGKSGTLTKKGSGTVYDDFPGRAFLN